MSRQTRGVGDGSLFFLFWWYCHSREGGNPDSSKMNWFPAFAGMTVRNLNGKLFSITSFDSRDGFFADSLRGRVPAQIT
jgi:hypothetical protein